MTARLRSAGAISGFVLLALGTTMTLQGQTGAPNGEWRTYGGDLASTRYSALDQINAQNFSKLEVAWRFRPDSLGPRLENNLQVTPLVANGKMYLTAGARRAAVALDAATGEMLWMHSLNEGPRAAASPRQQSGRGLAYWTDGKEERILYVTTGYQLVALDAKDGHRVAAFGRDGIIDLKQDFDQQMDAVTGEVALAAAPVIAKDVIVIGAAHLAGGAPKSKTHEKGYIRAFDVRTGKRLWTFHTIPRPGEFGNDSWLNDSWSYTGNAGVWSQMSVDEELETVYMPVELPTGDYYGGNRPGNGLYGESVLAVDLRTGKRKWHYQLVHHGIWDHDIPCAPILVDLNVNGRVVKAVAQPTKQAWVYIFDRVTGQPIFPIEERPVEKGAVPGEWYSPDAAVCVEAARVRSPGRLARRSHRLHPGAEGGGRKVSSPLQARADFHAAGCQQSRRSAWHADAARGHRRRQLAGRFARPGDEDSLHLLEHEHQPAGPGAGRSRQKRFRLGFPVRRRRRRPARAAAVKAAARLRSRACRW